MPKSRKTKARAQGLYPTNKFQAAVLKREELSDWYGDQTPVLRDFFNAWRMNSLRERGVATMPTDITIPEMITAQKRRIDMTEFFYLTTDIAHLLHQASQTMPPHRGTDEDVPASHGFVWLETPLNFSLVDDRVPLLVRSISWAREYVGVGEQDVGPGLLTWEFSDSRVAYGRDELSDWPRALFTTPLFPVAFGSIRDGRIPWMCYDVDTAQTDPAEATRAALKVPSVSQAYREYQSKKEMDEEHVPIPPGSDVIKIGTEDGHWTVRVPEGNIIHFEPDHVGRFLQALFLFLRQDLPALRNEPHPLPQPMGKRFKDKGINASPISVITWRRREPGDYRTGTGRQLTVRHVRRGHWRPNNRRKINGEWVRYPVYVPPTIVGDPSLPFASPHTVVNKVSR